MNAPAEPIVILYIVETPLGAWSTLKPEIAEKYRSVNTCVVTDYYSKLPAVKE